MQRTDGDRQRRRDLADLAAGSMPARLLPWDDQGKACYLNTDGGPDSFLSRLADDMEAVQLEMAAGVLATAGRVLADPKAPAADIRYTGLGLAECLRDVLRIAASRGARLSGQSEEPQP